MTWSPSTGYTRFGGGGGGRSTVPYLSTLTIVLYIDIGNTTLRSYNIKSKNLRINLIAIGLKKFPF